MTPTFTPRKGMDLKRQDRDALRAWLHVDGVGVQSDGIGQRLKGRKLEFGLQISAFLASDPKRIKKAKLGEPIEYYPPTKETRG